MPRLRPTAVRAAAAAATVLSLAVVGTASAAMPSTAGLGARSGLVVVDARSGRTLLSRGGDVRRIPASVTKLFTVGTALRMLGPEWTPRTRVVATGAADGTAWVGDLYLVGGGDPTLTSATVRGLAGQTAEALAALGVTRLDGRVLADDTAFDDWRGAARTGRGTDRDMGGRLGALTVDRGAGTDPAQRAASVFRSGLNAAGLKARGKLGAGAAPSDAPTLAGVQGPPLARLAAATLGPSDNFYAETLLKDLVARDGVESACRVAAGLPPVLALPAPAGYAPAPQELACAGAGAEAGAATTQAGGRRLRATLGPVLGAAPRIYDGSGLSRTNAVSPTMVTRLLLRLNDDATTGPVLRAALPQAGRTGTLARRMRGTAAVGRCQAKTGTLNGVSALAGFCRTRRGRDVAFAILQNSGTTYAAHRFQDRFVARLASVG